MPLSTRLIERLSAVDLASLLVHKKRLEKVEPLKRKLARLQKAIEKIEKKIAKLTGGKPTGRRGRPRKARRGKVGRPAKRGRPAKKRGKMSAAARKRIALAVSRAQTRRWIAFRKAKKAKAKAAKANARKSVAKKRTKRVAKVRAVAPKPGTLSAQIQHVAGSESGQG